MRRTAAALSLIAVAWSAPSCGSSSDEGPTSGGASSGGAGSGGQATGGSSSGGAGATDAAAGSGGADDAATGGAAGAPADAAADAWQPDPIPTLDPDPPAACAAAQSGSYFQFLDDVCQAKQYPTVADREFACPVSDPSPKMQLTGGGEVTYAAPGATLVVDDTALAGVVPSSLDVAVILVKRVAGVPHFRYLSNGTHAKVLQPWSTSKFLAAANAASNLRLQSSYKVGLTASTGATQLGDLVTSLHNYDNSPYSSNSLGRYFHNIGGRKRANDLIHALWLDRPAAETFGGNYGEAAPGLGYVFKETGGDSVTLQPDTTTGPANALSMLTLAEALKRLVLHREVAATRLPGIQWADLRVLLYGAEGSTKYGDWGGMSADTAVYLQSAHDIDYLDKRGQGRWRIFSKLGLGSSGQFLNVGYACFPVLDPSGSPVAGLGRELVIAAHLPSGGTTWRQRDRLLATYYRAIVTRVVDGRL